MWWYLKLSGRHISHLVSYFESCGVINKICEMISEQRKQNYFQHQQYVCWWRNAIGCWDIFRRSVDHTFLNTLRPRQMAAVFPTKFSSTFSWTKMNNIQSLVQIIAWHLPGDKSLSEPMMVSLPTHICVIQPQWVKTAGPALEGFINHNITGISQHNHIQYWHEIAFNRNINYLHQHVANAFWREKIKR